MAAMVQRGALPPALVSSGAVAAQRAQLTSGRLALQPVDSTHGYIPVEIPAGSVEQGPHRAGDQGISAFERPAAEPLIRKMLKAPGVQWLATWNAVDRTYDLIGRDGRLSFKRLVTPSGEAIFQIVRMEGSSLVPGTDGRALRTYEQELGVSTAPGGGIPASAQHYPDLLRRLAQIFDDPKTGDFVYIPFGYADPNHPSGGSHGTPTITQSRAPLIMAGPGITPGQRPDVLARIEDIAPTVLHFLGGRPVMGRNGSGTPRMQYMQWQDGDSRAAAVADARLGASGVYGAADRAMVFVIDGLSNTTLMDEVRKGTLPNIARIMQMGATFQNGSLADYPTVTWANHNALVTGTSPGHSGIPNNSWYVREQRREQLITDGSKTNVLRTGRFLNPEIETMFEAVRRSFGDGAVTLSLNDPSGRGATMSTLDLLGVGLFVRNLFGIGKRFLDGKKTIQDAEGNKDKEYKSVSWQDNLAAAAGAAMLDKSNPAKLAVFELALVDNQAHHHGPRSAQARRAMHEADRNIGRVLAQLDKGGLTDKTLLVVTADHGMEHQANKGLGGWKKAIKKSGIAAIDSTRFVYVRSMRLAAEVAGGPGGTALVVRAVDDDVDEKGINPPVAGATVSVKLPDGRTVSAVTGDDGMARISLPAGATGEATVKVNSKDLTPATTTVSLGG